MQQAQAIGASDLVSQDAPRLLEPARFTVGSAHFHAFFHIQLIESQGSDARLRRRHPNVLDEFLNSRQVGQPLWLVDQVIKCDQRVGFTAAIGQFQLAHCFFVFARQAQYNIFSQLAQVVCGIREGKELSRVFIDRPPAFLHLYIVQIGGKDGQR